MPAPVEAISAPPATKPTFIDLFAGCGGLSLGLSEAGWRGLFAVEKNKDAFETLRSNLIDGEWGSRFDWPSWLPVGAHEVEELTRQYKDRLASLRGKVDLIVGGPPCQGFSSAGRRDPDDPRNQLFKRYLKIVRLVQPKMLLLENVRGISSTFGEHANVRKRRKTGAFSEVIERRLKAAGYKTFPALLRASELGVPQMRPRFFMVGVRRESPGRAVPSDPFEPLELLRKQFLDELGLKPGREVSVREAISDLRANGRKTIPCVDSAGFNQIRYTGPRTKYQQQMHEGMNGHAPNSMRLANHSTEITKRFGRMIEHARKGVSLSDAERKRYGVKKMSVVVQDPRKPSHTLTTLPDDYVHYAEPRIMTVREYARIQSFPDWFEFLGCYTTGGERRKRSCPRYTQVGNAVPPRVATFLGRLLLHYSSSTGSQAAKLAKHARAVAR